jgi:hypothetical protein
MASTQVTRAAAQLHEAALDMARVAALRSAQTQDPPPGLRIPQPSELTEDGERGDRPVTAGIVGDEMDRRTSSEACL